MSPVAERTLVAVMIAGAFGLGVWAAPHIDPPEPVVVAAAPSTDVVLPREADRVRATDVPARTPVLVRGVEVAADADVVRDQAKPLLTWGTDTQKAAEGFSSAEQFLTVAHAAHNTDVPFVLLKHRVLNEKQSLSEAIKASKPDVDAALEAERAALNARSDLLRVAQRMS